MIVYKVVKQEGFASYTSFCTHGLHELFYIINKRTSALKSSVGVLVFDTWENAQDFLAQHASMGPKFFILKAKTDRRCVKEISKLSHKALILNKKYSHFWTMPAPLGTLATPSITPLEIIEVFVT